MHRKFIVKKEYNGERLDSFVAFALPDSTRSQIKKWADKGNIKVDGEVRKGSYKVKEGGIIELFIEEPKEISAEPQNIPINILYEDMEIVVVNKSADMVVHPAPGNADGTLVNALLYHCKNLSGIGGELRPGIVHRLDKGTSGVIIAAKNDRAHLSLSRQFMNRTTEKRYLALVYGSPKNDNGVFKQEIGRHPTERKKMSTKTRKGRDACTEWRILERFGKSLSLIEILLRTGRTHQIRVHFSAGGMPLVGDQLYGGNRGLGRLPSELQNIIMRAKRPLLHAQSLVIMHPENNLPLKFTAELPEDFSTILNGLRKMS